MRPPLITSVTSTDTTISVTWRMNKSATSALPSSYELSVFTEAAVNANLAGATEMQEPLSANSFTFTGLAPGTSYYVGVGTNNAWGDAFVSSLIATAQPTTTTTSVPATSTTTTLLP
jgi:Fibronectin type III domain